jgi:uncharacterized protein (DUF1499 family)
MPLNLKSLGGAALVVALAGAVMLLLTGPFYRLGLWSLQTAFTVITAGIVVGILGFVLAAVALWRAGGRSPFAILALIVALVAVAIPLRFLFMARSVPPIHDISTDTANPPTFEAIVPLRKDAPNSLEYTQNVAAQQRAAYPDIKPLIVEMPAAQVFDRASRAATEAGWEIAASSADSWRIEATDTTPFFGFKDDVVVRLTPIGNRTVVDVRSVSRVGQSDVGTNARRIRDYLAALSR